MSRSAPEGQADVEPRTRDEIARKAIRELAWFLVAATAAAAVLFRFGQGPWSDGLGLLLLGFAIFVAVVTLGPSLWERRLPRLGWPRQGKRDIRWALVSLVGCVTIPAALRAATTVLPDWSVGQVWILLVVLILIEALVDLGLRLLRPQGWTGVGTSLPRAVPLALIVVSVVIGLAAFVQANGLVATSPRGTIEDQMVAPPEGWYVLNCSRAVIEGCQPDDASAPAIRADAMSVVVGLGFGAVLAWQLAATRLAFGLIAAVYVILVFWSEDVWKRIGYGAVLVGADGPRILLLQIIAGTALLTVVPLMSIFRRRRSSATPRRARAVDAVTPSVSPST